LREIGGAALVWQGLALGLVVSAGGRARGTGLVALIVAMCLHSEVVWLVGVLGLGDSALGLSARVLRRDAREVALARQGADLLDVRLGQRRLLWGAEVGVDVLDAGGDDEPGGL
ncbi:MAG: hypothetical protein QF464_15905, partial [Myxococcota bacterium]|nr:hypothetical protein [Myxococcota bacterium]